MKFCPHHALLAPRGSPPSRGAWIEIIHGGRIAPHQMVAPLTGGVD